MSPPSMKTDAWHHKNLITLQLNCIKPPESIIYTRYSQSVRQLYLLSVYNIWLYPKKHIKIYSIIGKLNAWRMTTLNCLNIYAACAQMQKGYKTERRRDANLCAVLNGIHWNIPKVNFDSLLSFSRIYCVPYLKSSIRQVSWNIDFFINTSLF